MTRTPTLLLFLAALLSPAMGLGEVLQQQDAHAPSQAPTAASELRSTAVKPAQPIGRRPTTRRPILAEYPRSSFDRAFVVDPRVRPLAGDAELLRFALHGEYAVSYVTVPSLRLATYGFDDYRDSLGQSHRLEHALRLTPQLTYRRSFTVTSQFDLARGMLDGRPTNHVQADPEPLDEQQPMQFVPRWLYVDVRLDSGNVLIGQQPSSWGLGLVDSSGDDRQFFGDSKAGTIVDRIAYVGHPLGPRHPWELLVATDWIFSDGRLDTVQGDRAIRGVIANSYVVERSHRLGLLIAAERLYPHFDDSALRQLGPQETRYSFDLAGHTETPIRGIDVRVFAAAETVWIGGDSDVTTEVLKPRQAAIQRFGALARVGLMQTKGPNQSATGPWGVALEWGYASGDADPTDGTDHRFSMNPSRRTGLILFDETLRWKTARAAVALEDPRLGERSSGASWALPSGGAVTGATYLMPQLVYRPLAPLDFHVAALVAQSTSDVVDPTWLVMQGRYANYDGGDVAHHDLGLELDASVEYRYVLPAGLGTSLRLETAVLFPGRAFTNDNGDRLGRQSLVRGRFGFYF